MSLGVVVLAFSLWSDCIRCGANQLCRVSPCTVIPTSAWRLCVARHTCVMRQAYALWGLSGLCWGLYMVLWCMTVLCKAYVYHVAVWAL